MLEKKSNTLMCIMASNNIPLRSDKVFCTEERQYLYFTHQKHSLVFISVTTFTTLVTSNLKLRAIDLMSERHTMNCAGSATFWWHLRTPINVYFVSRNFLLFFESYLLRMSWSGYKGIYMPLMEFSVRW